MKKHNGMRPHDVIVLLKIAAKANSVWLMKDLGEELGISFSEISEAINRNRLAGLIAEDKSTLMREALIEFLVHGLKYVFPQRPGSLVRGLKTAFAAPPLSELIDTTEVVVWSWPDGPDRGFMIEPLHPNVPKACLRDESFYALAALAETFRIGKVREVQMAEEILMERLYAW